MSDRNVGISAFSVICLVIMVAIGNYLCKKRNERLTWTSPVVSEPGVELGNNHDSKPQARDVDEEGKSGGIDVVDLSLEKGENAGDIEKGTNVDIQMPIALSDYESHDHSWSDVDELEDIPVKSIDSDSEIQKFRLSPQQDEEGEGNESIDLSMEPPSKFEEVDDSKDSEDVDQRLSSEAATNDDIPLIDLSLSLRSHEVVGSSRDFDTRTSDAEADFDFDTSDNSPNSKRSRPDIDEALRSLQDV